MVAKDVRNATSITHSRRVGKIEDTMERGKNKLVYWVLLNLSVASGGATDSGAVSRANAKLISDVVFDSSVMSSLDQHF